MSVKLGSGAINKIYLGATEAKKAYLWSTLIYDKTGGGGGGTLSIALTDDKYSAVYPNPTLTVSCAFGAAATDRRIVCCMVTDANSSTFTIGGVAAAVHSTTADGSGYWRYIISANVPTGTSGNVVGASCTEIYGGLTFAITGAASTVDQTASGGASSGSIAVSAGGVVVAWHSRTSSTTITASSWTALTGTTPRWDTGNEYYSAGYDAFASAQTVNYSVTYTGTTGGSDQGNGAVSFKP